MVADAARRTLGLDQVWLMVSPGNPLKPVAGMAPMQERMASARSIADGRQVVATGIEARLGTRFSVDTMRQLRRRFPRTQFVWLCGADIMPQLPRWRRWPELLAHMPFVVLPRPGYTTVALRGRIAHRLRHDRRRSREARLVPSEAPAWVFLPHRQVALSSTALRAAAKETVP